MRRLTKENFKQLGRQIGKITHSNPLTLCELLIGQIQAYDNLIGPVTDAQKYMSLLSLDVVACTSANPTHLPHIVV